MASELAHIKSKMLLPKPDDFDEGDDDVDPRAELVRRLLEYEKYKHAAQQLDDLARLGREVFGRPPEPLPPFSEDAPLREVGVYALIQAFDSVLKRNKPELRHRVEMEQISVRRRIESLIDALDQQESLRFDELVGDLRGRIDVVVTLLAMLEMAKHHLLRIFQSEEGVIYLSPRFSDPRLARSRLGAVEESYAG